MKKLITYFSFLLLSFSIFAQNAKNHKSYKFYHATDSNITFIGRNLHNQGAIEFSWTGVYAKIKFKGVYLAIKAKDTKCNYFNVWIDKKMYEKPDRIIKTGEKDSIIVLTDKAEMKKLYPKSKKKEFGVHTVIIQKRTEGEQGKTTIYGFFTNGELLKAQPIKKRVIEFVGDSYTCGFGTESESGKEPFKPETENCNLAYGPICSRFFNADYVLIAHSGMGITRNYNDKFIGDYMPDRYMRTFDEDKNPEWIAKAHKIKPSLTIIYLCTNDFSTGRQPSIDLFKKNYIKLLKEIKSNYGEDYPILCIAGSGNTLMPEYIRASVEAANLPNVYYMFLTKGIHNMNTDLGACSHPNYMGQKKKATAIIPYISTITGWEMEDKPIR